MKKLLIVALLLPLMVGCANNPKPQTLPTGANSVADAQTYRVLSDAQAFLNSIRTSVTAGTISLTATQKTAFNDVATSYNAAEALWQTCHAGGCSAQQQTQLTTQVNTLNAQLTTAQKAITQ
jgi:outer membrane murein-binding lipoprotein Lpp